MTLPYPLRTEPFFRDYIWGGRKLETVLGKPIPSNGVWAESWEMIDHPEHQSLVTNGALAGQTLRQIAAQHKKWILGGSETPSLPLLLKYLDCQRDLSVQVHPEDSYAKQMTPPDLGKTEAWYIISAEPGAKLFAGLKPGVTPDQLRNAIANETVEECLHVIEPKVGDCVFIPAGTVHALGAGLLVAEIQQASNTTFRLYDWGRVGADGKPRQLHVEQALEVIDFSGGPRPLQTPVQVTQGRENLVHCEKFVLDRLCNIQSTTVAGDGKFHLLTAPYGGVTISWESETNGIGMLVSESLDVGQSVMLPASMPVAQVELSDASILLDMHMPS